MGRESRERAWENETFILTTSASLPSLYSLLFVCQLVLECWSAGVLDTKMSRFLALVVAHDSGVEHRR